MSRRLSQCPVVQVEWVDSRRPSSAWEWLSQLVRHKAVICASVGWLVQQHDDVWVLAQTVGDFDEEDDAQVMGCVVIPVKSITDHRVLSEP